MIRNFAEIPSSELAAVADLNQERLTAAQTRYPAITVTQDYHDLFAMDLDAVVIATPPGTHYPIAKECLNQGLHTLVEKPLTLESAHAQELVDLADSKGLTLMVGHTFEYNAAVRELKRLIDNGDLGQIFYIDAVRVNLGLFQRNLNVMWDLAPHDVSILLYLLEQPEVTVSARGTSCVFEGVHDVVYMNLMFPNGSLAHIRVSWLDPNKTRRITVVGNKKMVVYDDVESLEKIKIYDKGVDVPPYTDSYGDFQCSYRYGDVLIPNIRFVEPLRLECQHFIDCILQGTEPQSSGRVGMNVVRVLEAADRSLQNGGAEHTVSLSESQLVPANGDENGKGAL
jgi:predicted dehydrogenase